MTNAPSLEPHPDATATIRRLNDALRTTGVGGRTMVTAGIAALPDTERSAALAAVANFDDFDCRNDPYGERDCAVVTAGDLQVLWKIDYYDLDLAAHSPDPANADVTRRILTIMLAEDY